MFNRRTTLVMGSMAIGAMALAGCGGAEGAEDADVVLKFTSFEPEQIQGPQAKKFADAVAEATDGEISVEFYWSESLLPADEMAKGIAAGVADVGMYLPPYNPSDFPVSNWATALAAAGDSSFPLNVVQQMSAYAEFALDNEEIVEEFESQGLKILSPQAAFPSYNILCDEPVTSLEDARGTRIRVGGQLWAKQAEAVGMEPVALAGSEVYEALQRGIVDCVMHYPTAYIGNSLWDIGKEFTTTDFTGWNAQFIVIGLDKWNSLSLEHQQAVWDAGVEYYMATLEKTLDDYERFATEGIEEHDLNFHEPDAQFVAAIDEAKQASLDAAQDSPPTGVTDPDAFIAEYMAVTDYWGEYGVNELGLAANDDTPPAQAWTQSGDLDVNQWRSHVKEMVFDKHRPQ